MTMLGMAARKIHDGLAFCARLAGSEDAEIARQVEASKSQFRGFELAGKTLGVLGLGKIGVRVANAAALQRMRVVGFDPLPALDNVHELLPQVTLARSSQDVVRQADVLTVHVPLDNSTRGMVGAALLAQLPAGALLVNYARGQVVDEPAVLQALDGGRLAAYITDFPSAALLKHPRVLATPHLGASTEESEEQCARMAVQELRAYLEHGTVTHSVNFPTAESMPPSGARTRLIMINRDIPDMIGFVSHAIGSRRINICSYLNESNGTIGYNIIDVEQAIPAEVLAEIGRHPGVIRTRTIDCGQG
jgi:D-3-phosphoglycerate dehydrogenase